MNATGITALVLAGGRGARMGGVDKGLQLFRGQPLVWHALQRLAGQQGLALQRLAGQQGLALQQVLVSANRNAAQYLALAETVWGGGAATVVADHDAAFLGPLAGVQAGLAACRSPLLLTVPCDSPCFPHDLALRLLHALQEADAEMAVVYAPQAGPQGELTLRSQPVFGLMRSTVAPRLAVFLASGGRKVGDWLAQLRVVQVPFHRATDNPRAFANANTLQELQALERG